MRAGRAVLHRNHPDAVYIGRPSKWGNPFSHKLGTLAAFRVASRQEAVDAYRRHLLSSPIMLAELDELAGRDLGCFCAPALCHGDVLAELSVLSRIAVCGSSTDTVPRRLGMQGRAIVVTCETSEAGSVAAQAAESLGHVVAPQRDWDDVLTCRPHLVIAFCPASAPGPDILGPLRAAWHAGVAIEMVGPAGERARHVPAGADARARRADDTPSAPRPGGSEQQQLF